MKMLSIKILAIIKIIAKFIVISLVAWSFLAYFYPIVRWRGGGFMGGFSYLLVIGSVFAISKIISIRAKRNISGGMISILILGVYIFFVLIGAWNNMRNDKALISYNLDGLADIKVPKSFTYSKQSLANFYYLHHDEYEDNKFTYSFYLERATFSDASNFESGGTSKPVNLFLTVYEPSVSFESWDQYVNTTISIGWDCEAKISDIKTLSKNDTGEFIQFDFISENCNSGYFDKATFLVYSYQNADQKYRLGLFFWPGYLNDDAAKELLYEVMPTVVIKDKLSSRLRVIEDEFYKKYPGTAPDWYDHIDEYSKVKNPGKVADDYYLIDLNNDGRLDLLEYDADGGACGTAGCPLFIYTYDNLAKNFFYVSEVSSVRAVFIGDTYTNGWRDIVVGVGEVEYLHVAGFYKLQYNGREYPNNRDIDGIEIPSADGLKQAF